MYNTHILNKSETDLKNFFPDEIRKKLQEEHFFKLSIFF